MGPRLRDLSPTTESFLTAVLAGLEGEQKSLPCKFFYDETGALLFEAICTLDEYYPTRTEFGILEDQVADIAKALGPGVRLVEPGSGSQQKARMLLAELDSPVGFVPIDISREQLEEGSRVLDQDFPGLTVQPVCADYSEPFDLPPAPAGTQSTVIYFPGSTIGNFEPDEATAFLRRLRELAGEDGAVLIGVDLSKNPEVLHRAYDDPSGVTAAFNRNLLARINRELGADFDVAGFEHRARYQRKPSRIVIELVSRRAQTVTIDERQFEFAAGETILTEFSHKPTLEDFARQAGDAGLRVAQVWTDPQGWFSVQLLRPV